jgi:hypothetical protein
LWRNGHIVDLGAPAGFSFATGINARGDVIGRLENGHAFQWSVRH